MDKKVALHRLRSLVVNGEPLARSRYVEQIDGKTCYCAVGHLMKECGIDLTPIAEQPELNEMEIIFDEFKEIRATLEQYGFTYYELKEIQFYNDVSDYEGMLRFIDKLLVPIG